MEAGDGEGVLGGGPRGRQGGTAPATAAAALQTAIKVGEVPGEEVKVR